MDDKMKRNGQGGSRRITLGAFLSASVLVMWSSGCTDHRISVDEFLTLEQERQLQEAPTTQPVEVEQDVALMIDERLGPYKVGNGDVLNVHLSGLDADILAPMHVRIDRHGKVDLPGVPEGVQLAGKELEDVEDVIRQAYVPNIYPEAVVNVMLVEPDETKVVVKGAAITPGMINLKRTERDLLHALVSAGGISQAASGHVHLTRLRRPSEKVTLDLYEAEGLQAALSLPPLENGDIVTVEAATPNQYFVGGLVLQSAPQEYPAGTNVTVLQAIAAAGGLRQDVTPREATLIRRMEDGSDVHVKLNLDRTMTGQDPNLALAAGDVLWVPHTAETRIQEWVNRNIFFRAGVSTTATVNYSATGAEFLNDNARAQSIRTGDLEDSFDPFGFLLRNAAIQQIPTGP